MCPGVKILLGIVAMGIIVFILWSIYMLFRVEVENDKASERWRDPLIDWGQDRRHLHRRHARTRKMSRGEEVA